MPAFFYPWNPLSLSNDIDSGLRVDRGLVHIPLYSIQNKLKYLVWSASIHDNLAFFTQDESDVVELCKRVSKNLGARNVFSSVQVRLYDFHKNMEWADQFANKAFQRVPYPNGFLQFTQDYVEFRNNIDRTTLKSGVIESGTKQLQLLLIPMGSEEMKVFQTSQIAQRNFMDILRNSHNARMFPWFIMENPAVFSADFCKLFSMSIYMGADNAQFAHDVVYPDLPLSRYGIYKQVVGVAESLNKRWLMRLHPISTQQYSEWGKRMKEYTETEEAEYRAYLNSLKG